MLNPSANNVARCSRVPNRLQNASNLVGDKVRRGRSRRMRRQVISPAGAGAAAIGDRPIRGEVFADKA